MHLIPLGRLAGMPANGQASSGYLLRGPTTTVMLDAGPGTALALSRHLADGAPDLVYISHEHTDHLFDLLPIGKMLLAIRLRRDEDGLLHHDERLPRVPLLIPTGGAERLARIAALYPVTTHPLLDRAFELAFHVIEYEPGFETEIHGMRLRTALLRHVAPNCGVRLEHDGASLVYTGDTGMTPAIAELARDATTLLSECTLDEPDVSGHGHLCAAEAGAAAAEAGVDELVLTHFSSTEPRALRSHVARASDIFGGRVRVAEVDSALPIPDPRKVKT